MKLKLALAQIATKLGDVDSNLEKHLEYIKQAKSEKADLLVFPELSLTGYVLQDLVASAAHRPTEDDPVFKHLLKASEDLDLVVGFVDEDDRHRFFIASAYLSGGKTVHVHHKVYLPTYGLFDEDASLPGATPFVPSIRASDGWVCSSVKISGTPHRHIYSGWMVRILCYFRPLHLGVD
ncbi:MAG: nitrilase-related carbon-nitrogen hydrolase [Anaerolineales bacterium]